jgi:hypothetical protein
VGEHVRVLDTHFPWTDTSLLDLLQHTPHLNELTIQIGDWLTDHAFEQLGQRCPQLCKLVLRTSPITQAAMVGLGRHCQQLKYLELGRCDQLGWDMFTALASCPLVEVSILLCDLLLNSTSAATTFYVGLNALAAQHGLQFLRIVERMPSLPYHAHPQFDPTVTWPQLTFFSMEKSLTLNEAQAIALIQSHPSLTFFSLQGGDLTDATLDAVINNKALSNTLGAIGILENPSITASGICRLAQHCPLLYNINIKGCGLVPSDFPEFLWPHFNLDDDGGGGLAFVDWVDMELIDLIRQHGKLNNSK